MINMKEAEWRNLRHFSPNENWGDPDKMGLVVVTTLHRMRIRIGKPCLIHCGWEERNDGYHPMGMAIDFHVEGMHPVDMYLEAERYDEFNGIGIYTWWHWNNEVVGGLHVDTRPKYKKFEIDSRWMSIEKGKYVPLNWNLLKSLN